MSLLGEGGRMNFPDKKYQIIYADPPWEYEDKLTGGKVWGSVENHYSTMSLTDICNLPVNQTNEFTSFLPQVPASMTVLSTSNSFQKRV